MNRRLLTGLVLVAGLSVPPATAAPPARTATALTGATTRVSVSTGGAQANSYSYGPALSADGRFVAFGSAASNIVAGDTNSSSDAFLRDRQTGVTTRVSVATGGRQARGSSYPTSISADGRYIVFDSDAKDLDASTMAGVFVRDRKAGTTTRVSVSSRNEPANPDAYGDAISGDGRFVVFTSLAANLVTGDTNDVGDVFVHDRLTGATTRISVATRGIQANDISTVAAINGDGRYVSFTSGATNLVSGDTNGQDDVFLHDRVTGITTRMSVAASGAQADAASGPSSISADGRYIAFESDATNLVAGHTSGRGGVFVHDRVTGETKQVDLTTTGGQPEERGFSAALSRDGRYVTFESSASSLVVGDTNAASDVFVHDRITGATTRVNVSTAGSQPINLDSFTGAGPKLSGDGRYIAFASPASNLVAGDTNASQDGGISGLDVFVRDRLAVVPSTPVGDFDTGGWSDVITRQTATGDLWLYPGNGVGFTARARVGTGWNSMSAITRLGDVNRDGHEDVVARDKGGVLWLYPGTGTGFVGRVKMGSWGWNAMREITPVGDLNSDGYPDLLSVQTSTGGLYLYPGRGTSFGARQLLGFGWNAMSELAGVGDFNHDSHPDLVARHSATGELWLYPGRTGGLDAKRRIGTGWSGMRDLSGVGDFDRDGYNDLFGVQTATGRLLIYPGRGTSLGVSLQVGTGWTGYRPLL